AATRANHSRSSPAARRYDVSNGIASIRDFAQARLFDGANGSAAAGASAISSAACASAPLPGSVVPATTYAPRPIASANRSAQSGAGTQSSSVKQTTVPPAAFAPVLRAAAGPHAGCLISRAPA